MQADELEHDQGWRAIADRERARADALEAELAALRASLAWRVTSPLRRLAAAVPPSLYARLRRRHARPTNQWPDTGEHVALLIDDTFPSPDRDAGSIEIVHLAEALAAFGLDVFFAARLDDDQDRQGALRARGIRTIPAAAASGLEAFLCHHADQLTLVVLNRVYCGGAAFETVRTHAPRARIVFNTIDLHWIRVGREAELANDPTLRLAAADLRARELHLARETDATIVVSAAEAEILRAEAPGARVVTLPLARPTTPPTTPFAARGGVGFIGAFRHAPNRDAIVWFARAVWPLVIEVLPDCRLSIAGPDMPDGLLDGVPGHVEILGHVPDIGPWFEGLRLTVAPLRFGAGAKGKLVSSLAAGVPCVATPIALEGMGLTDADGAIRADTPDAMAKAITSLHEDQTSWERLSPAACRAVEEHFSLGDWRARLAALLETLQIGAGIM
jgi:hypothetical protein